MSKYVLHGVAIEDPYHWLEDLDSAETQEWVAAQNEKTAAYLDAIPERGGIRRRLTELWNYEKVGTPHKEGGRYFFTRNNGLQNQSVLCVVDRLGDAPRVLLDPNMLAPDGTVALTSFAPSPDGRLLAYGLASAGSDWEEWRILDVATGQPTSDHLQWVKFSRTSWTQDSAGFFYCRYDEPGKDTEFQGANYFQKLFYHRVGTPQSADTLIYHSPDDKERVFDAVVSDDGRFLILHVWRGTSINNAVFYRDLQAAGSIVELIANFEAKYQFVGNAGHVLWFQTDRAAPRGRLIAIDTSHQQTEVIPQREHALESVSVVGGHFIAQYFRDARSDVVIVDLNGEVVRQLPLPGIGTVSGFAGRPEDPETFFDFMSFTTPSCVYRYDVSTGETALFHKPTLAFDPDDYVTRQEFFPSKDGTLVPMFISHKRGLTLNGRNPVELYGYGGFNIALTPMYSTARLAWMEMGGVFVSANLRGGSEYGEEWHQAGTRSRKQNVFDDFMAAAEWLIAKGYTSPDHLGISGRSNGGLLVGACVTQRPDLFGAALAGVGVMDMLRFHKFTIGWSWVSDYGSPDNPEDFSALIAYSPYHNIRKGVAYPPTLVVTADHDDRVVPGHSYKFAAALQAAHAGVAPILIRVDVRAGHGMGKPTAKLIDEAADILSFFLAELK